MIFFKIKSLVKEVVTLPLFFLILRLVNPLYTEVSVPDFFQIIPRIKTRK